MRKLIASLVVGVVLGSTTLALATDLVASRATFSVLVNGKEFKSDKPIVAIDGSTYLPLKATGDALGVKVAWNSDLKRVEVGAPKELTIENFISALKENKFDVGPRITEASTITGARESYNFKVNGATVGFQIYDLESKDELTVKTLKEINDTGKMTVSFGSFTEPVTFPVVINKDAVLMCDTHPDKEKLIQIFKSF